MKPSTPIVKRQKRSLINQRNSSKRNSSFDIFDQELLVDNFITNKENVSVKNLIKTPKTGKESRIPWTEAMETPEHKAIPVSEVANRLRNTDSLNFIETPLNHAKIEFDLFESNVVDISPLHESAATNKGVGEKFPNLFHKQSSKRPRSLTPIVNRIDRKDSKVNVPVLDLGPENIQCEENESFNHQSYACSPELISNGDNPLSNIPLKLQEEIRDFPSSIPIEPVNKKDEGDKDSICLDTSQPHAEPETIVNVVEGHQNIDMISNIEPIEEFQINHDEVVHVSEFNHQYVEGGHQEKDLGNSRYLQAYSQIKSKSTSICEPTSGFQTAAGATVDVSSISLNKARSILYDDPKEYTSEYLLAQESSTVERKPVELDGFRTASGAGLKISSSSILRAKSMMNQEGYSFGYDRDQAESDSNRKSTDLMKKEGIFVAADINLEASSERFNRAQGFLSFNESTIPPKTPEEPIHLAQGLFTASGKKVEISAESMNTSLSIFSELHDSVSNPTNTLSTDEGKQSDHLSEGFLSSKTTRVSEESRKQALNLFSFGTENVDSIQKSNSSSSTDSDKHRVPEIFDSNKVSKREDKSYSSNNKLHGQPTQVNSFRTPLKNLSGIDQTSNRMSNRLSINNFRTPLLNSPSPNLFSMPTVIDTPIKKSSTLFRTPIKARGKFKQYQTPLRAIDPKSVNSSLMKPFRVPITPGLTPTIKRGNSKTIPTSSVKEKQPEKPSIQDELGVPFAVTSSFTNFPEASYKLPDLKSYQIEGMAFDQVMPALIERGASPNLLKTEWVSNHYKQVLWKLSGYIKAYPNQSEKIWNMNHVLDQLFYRYQKEINGVSRSAIRLICEKDDLPSRFMVLCVADIINEDENVFLLLTDAWYSIRAICDRELQRIVKENKIFIGMKLCIHGAKISGLSEPCPPLEIKSSTVLQISANSVRRAHWNSTLGYQKHRFFTVSLKSILSQGGVVPCIDVIVMRKYSVRYMEITKDGKVFRTRKEEEIAKKKHEDRRLELYTNLKKKYDTSNTRKSHKEFKRIDSNTSVEDIFEQFTASRDQSEFFISLSKPQQEELRSFIDRVDMSKKQDSDESIQAELEELHPKRNVIRLMCMKICDYPWHSSITRDHISETQLKIWNADEDVVERIREGDRMKIFQAIPTQNGRNNIPYLKVHHLKYQALSIKQEYLEKCDYRPRRMFCGSELSLLNRGDEVDIIVKVVNVEHTERGDLQVFCVDHTNVQILLYAGSRNGMDTGAMFQIGNVVILENIDLIIFDRQKKVAKLRLTTNSNVLGRLRTEMENKIKKLIEEECHDLSSIRNRYENTSKNSQNTESKDFVIRGRFYLLKENDLDLKIYGEPGDRRYLIKYHIDDGDRVWDLESDLDEFIENLLESGLSDIEKLKYTSIADTECGDMSNTQSLYPQDFLGIIYDCLVSRDWSVLLHVTAKGPHIKTRKIIYYPPPEQFQDYLKQI